jgi:hypothetical protein
MESDLLKNHQKPMGCDENWWNWAGFFNLSWFGPNSAE